MTEHVYWTWQAEVQPGKEAGFRELASRWKEIAEADAATLYSEWSISEDGKSVQVDQRFEDSASANAQFQVNDCWKQLDDYLVPTDMAVCGAYGEDLDWLREHGARFMKLV